MYCTFRIAHTDNKNMHTGSSVRVRRGEHDAREREQDVAVDGRRAVERGLAHDGEQLAPLLRVAAQEVVHVRVPLALVEQEQAAVLARAVVVLARQHHRHRQNARLVRGFGEK